MLWIPEGSFQTSPIADQLGVIVMSLAIILIAF